MLSLQEIKYFIEKLEKLKVSVFEKLISTNLKVLKDLEKQAINEIYPPEFVYGHVIKQLNEFINYSYDDHPLYSQFIMKVDKLELSGEDLKNLDQKIKKAIDESVTPGFKLLLGFMKKTQKNANKNHGIWSQPGGDEY